MNQNKPLVSIITITRNRAHLIDVAIRSILMQTYSNLEYIIVNGASTDNTVSVVESFNDDRIRLINLEENLSVMDSYKLAVREAKGVFVTMLDDDDEYVLTKIEKQFNLIDQLTDDYGLVYCWADIFDYKTGKKIREHRPALRGDVSELVVEKSIVSGTPMLFLRKEVFEKALSETKDIGIISDWELAARICQLYKVDFVPEVLVKGYENHGSIRMSEADKYYKDYCEKGIIFHSHFLSEFSNIFEKHPFKKVPHLSALTSYCFTIGKYSLGINYYFQLLKLNASTNNILRPIRGIGRAILIKIKN